MNFLSPEAWLNLGIPGAALLLVAIVVILIFKQLSKTIDKLCTKIDAIVDAFATNNLKLTEVVITNDRDQRQTLQLLSEIRGDVKNVQQHVIRIDTHLCAIPKERKNKAIPKERKDTKCVE